MEHHRPAVTAYSIVGLVALALILSATGGGEDAPGKAVFGGLFLSASVSGLLGVLAGSGGHVWWALAGFFLPGYSLPSVLYYGLKGWGERARLEERLEAAGLERLADEGNEQALAEQRERAAPLAELAERLRRLQAECSEEFKRLPACEGARRFLAEYEASGPTAEAAALAEQAARETSEALSALVADVPDVAHRDFRGERWAPGPQLVRGALEGSGGDHGLA